MPSRPVIYVNRITNLSDARYCAGMGAEMLGFVVTPGHPDYVSPVQFKEIMGWVSGPRRVVEIVGGQPEDLEDVIAQYGPDLIHLSIPENGNPGQPSFPLILEVPNANLNPLLLENIVSAQTKLEYIVLPGSMAGSFLQIANKNAIPVLLKLSENASSIIELQERTDISGFVLQGTPELKPGLKDYDQLSKILEALDL